MRRALIAGLCVFLSTSLLSAQRAKVLAPHRPIAPRVPNEHQRPLPPAKSGSIVGGPWMVDANFKSSIYLSNGVATSAVTVRPVLYLSNGARYELSEVHLEPSATAVVDINAALQNFGIAPYATLTGYAEIDYSWPWDPVCATIRNLDTVHSLIFNYGMHSTKPLHSPNQPPPRPEPQSNVVDGLWWKREPNVTGFVALANTTGRSLNASLETSDNQGLPLAQHSVRISAHGTKSVALKELESAAATEGGIRISYAGNPDDLLINGGIQDTNSGYSAGLPFTTVPALSTASQATVAELGLMSGPADPMMQFPADVVFTPYAVVRNASSSVLTMTPTLWWMEGGKVQSAQLSTIQLGALQGRTLDVPALMAAAGLKNFSGSVNLVFDVQGNTGGLLMAGGSVDRNNTYVFGVSPHGVSESASKSLSYWSTANGDDTMVTLWNPADETQDLMFRLTFSGGHYSYPIHLDPRATRTFNISEIIQNQIPDGEGNIIPASIHEGSATLAGSQADNQPVLVAMAAGTYNVKKATCGEYCYTCSGWASTELDPNPFSVTVGGSVQMSFWIYFNDGSMYNYTGDPANSWGGSNNASVDQRGVVTGVAPGAANVGVTNNTVPGYWQGCLPAPRGCPFFVGTGAGASGTVGDATPVISGISPSQWNAGNTTQVTLNGRYFGTNAPTLNFSPGNGISYSLLSFSDTQIVANVSVAASTPDEFVNVSVTNNGYGGSGFLGGPGQTPTSASASANVRALPVSVNLSSPPPYRVELTKTVSLSAQGGPAGGTYSWSSGDPATVAIQSSSGSSVVLQGQKVGGAIVTVTYVAPSGLTATATANVQVTTAEIVVIGWINANAITLPGGANAALQAALNSSLCAPTVALWAAGTRTLLNSQADADYANAWLLQNSGNNPPPATINPASQLSGGDFRLFNDLQSSFFQSNGVISSATLTGVAAVGATPDPCGSGLSFVGQNHTNNSAAGVTSSAIGVYQLAEGRVGTTGQAVSLTINGRSVPWIWSVIKFDTAGNPITTDHAIFPTYSVYKDGVQVATYPQGSPSTFIALDDTYQRLPSEIQ